MQRTEDSTVLTEEVTHAYVLLREVGKKKWLYLDGKGGEAATKFVRLGTQSSKPPRSPETS